MVNNSDHQKNENKNKNEDITEFITSNLKWKVLNGQYSIGERITEQSIAAELNVSRNSVRMAIMKLINEGLLIKGPTGAVMVRDISIKEANEIIDMRRVLETYAVNQAIDHITPPQLSSLESILVSMEGAIRNRDFELYSTLNTRFHNIIYNSTGNDMVPNILIDLKTKMLRYQFKVSFIPGRAEQSYAEHADIYMALVKKDRKLAEQAVINHLESLRNCITRNKEILEIKEVKK